MRNKVVLLSMGTRPEIIKMAPVYHVLRQMPLEPVVLHTGQHEDMAWPLYDFFQIEPTYSLSVDRERPSLGHLSALLMDEIDHVLGRTGADALLVHGDTSSALMAALAGFYHKIPVGHVEAGLRSFDTYNPFPEEKNRSLIAQLAHWHFAPTKQAVQNLLAEGIPANHIHCVGNTVIDATHWGLQYLLPHFSSLPDEETRRLQDLTEWLQDGKLMLVTAHRRENWGQPIARVAETVRRLAEAHPELRVVWPVHPNPVVRDAVENALADLPPEIAERIWLLGPVTYPRMLWLLSHAWLLLTDSGGLQEEAAALKVPVLVLRKNTERPELIEAGGGVLTGTDAQMITWWVERLIADQNVHAEMSCIDNPFGDGRASEYIARTLYGELLSSMQTPLSDAA